MRIDEFRSNLIEALTEALPEGTPVFGWQDTKFVAPSVFVIPAEPFIDGEGHTTAAAPYATHWQVQLIAGRGSGDEVVRRLEEMVAATVIAISGVVDPNARLSIDSVEYPKFGTHEKVAFTGADLEITAALSLKES